MPQLSARKARTEKDPGRSGLTPLSPPLLAGKGTSLRAIAKALTRSRESAKDRARADKLKFKVRLEPPSTRGHQKEQAFTPF